jgi:hypothetical protein
VDTEDCPWPVPSLTVEQERAVIAGAPASQGQHNPCVPVQDAAEEAARSSSDHTDMADEQAGTQALPLCRHGYYAARCPHCQEDAA